MSARERLRAYLEQRRELGESEMVLDALDVEDVMRMMGALPRGESADFPPLPGTGEPPQAAAPAPARPDVPPARKSVADRDAAAAEGSAAPDDWRNMMQSLKGGVQPPRQPAPRAPEPSAGEAAEPSPVERPRAGILRIEGIVVPLGLRIARSESAADAHAEAWRSLADVTDAIRGCTACALVQTATRPVPGVGDPTADVLVVGEAPGEQEDLAGEPFVGPAGQLLTKILGAIQLSRESVYICNVLKHRPPGNRVPLPDEVRACAPFLQRQIDLVQPKIILAFGASAAQTLLNTKVSIGKLRQQVHWYQGIPLIATYHPAALLRNDAWKRPTWEDVKLARRVLDATVRTHDQS